MRRRHLFSIGTIYIVTGLGLILALWYLIAIIYNRRLGLRIYRWLQADLDELGDPESVQAGWIGSSGSGARIAIQRAHSPFRHLELSYLLESRELAPSGFSTFCAANGTSSSCARPCARSGPVSWKCCPPGISCSTPCGKR